MATAFASLFEASEDDSRSSVAQFLERLRQEGLLIEQDDALAASEQLDAPSGVRKKFSPPELLKHDEPLHEVPISPFDPQLPLAE
jgi:hypothetical protein